MAVNKLDISMMEDVGTSANQLLQRDGSGNLPVVDGSLITSLPADYTIATTDPLITTNPSATGAVWYNKVDGEGFVCTDNTAGANVWKNFGGGTSVNVEPVALSQGTSYGFLSGGYVPSVPVGLNIEKFTLPSNSNSVDHGADLTVSKNRGGGHQDALNGFNSGGAHPTSGAEYDVIDKFPLHSSTNATNVGTLVDPRQDFAACSSATDGYCAGGSGSPAYAGLTTISKFSFTSEGNTTDPGNLAETRYRQCGNSHIGGGYGYACGGGAYIGSWQWSTMIQKWAFASGGASDTTADLTMGRKNAAGIDDTSYCYIAGGMNPSYTDRIDKYQFATTSPATDIGNLYFSTTATQAGISHTSYGYYCGGHGPGGSPANVQMIQKWAYASSNFTATDHGDMVQAMQAPTGHHY